MSASVIHDGGRGGFTTRLSKSLPNSLRRLFIFPEMQDVLVRASGRAYSARWCCSATTRTRADEYANLLADAAFFLERSAADAETRAPVLRRIASSSGLSRWRERRRQGIFVRGGNGRWGWHFPHHCRILPKMHRRCLRSLYPALLLLAPRAEEEVDEAAVEFVAGLISHRCARPPRCPLPPVRFRVGVDGGRWQSWDETPPHGGEGSSDGRSYDGSASTRDDGHHTEARMVPKPCDTYIYAHLSFFTSSPPPPSRLHPLPLLFSVLSSPSSSGLPSPLPFLSTSSSVHPRPIHVHFRHHPHHLVPLLLLLLLFMHLLPPISRSSSLFLSADYLQPDLPELPRAEICIAGASFPSSAALVGSVLAVVDDHDGDPFVSDDDSP
ncbi:hypothetical protein B0H11DRAFT_2303709 [Mycena galericulata]|nr:hypothetical protein B0H11DRAFT_2303709 [Mycena galericulata]